LTGGVVFRALTHALNCYDVPAVKLRALALRTNTVSHTAFRGFGGPQGVVLMEDVLRHVAAATG
ncbi:MAG: molybdopterin cofactor-binding domain-containing protein, partial [Alphaproteobacteria bacterium]